MCPLNDLTRAGTFRLDDALYYVITHLSVDGWHVDLVTAAESEDESFVQLIAVAGEEPFGWEKGQVITLPKESLSRQCLDGTSEVISTKEAMARFQTLDSTMVTWEGD